MNNDNFPILKNSTPSTSEKNINFINEMISNTLFNRKTNGEINLHEFSSKAKTFRSYDKFLDTNELDAEKLKEIKAFMNSVDKLEPIRDGLICWLDGRDGNNNDRTTIWKDRSGNGNDATLVGFDFNENSGWGDGYLLNKVGDYGRIHIPKTLLEVGLTVEINFSKYNTSTHTDKFNDLICNTESGGMSISVNKTRVQYMVHDTVTYSVFNLNKTDEYNTTVSLSVNKASKVFRGNLNSNTLFERTLQNVRYQVCDYFMLYANPNLDGTPDTTFKCDPHKVYSVRIYNRALTPEEVRHNYLYDLSVQYLLKNQVNSNTIETYYDFDPNYDLPDNRIEGCLMVSNGRLVYYNPSGSAPLRIANNKTLDECIVEETEDYIIYSDGEVTPDNPIPEGIYFACRVDKHTGEIYYGEGYENLARNMYSNFTSNLAKVVVNSTAMEVRLLWTSGNKNDSISYPDVKVNLPTTLNVGDVFNCYYDIRYGTTPNRGLNINYNNESNGWLSLTTTGKDEDLIVPSDYSRLLDFRLVRYQSFNFTSGIVSILSKILLTKNKLKNKTPFVRTKCPYGQLIIQTNSSKNNSSFVITGTNYGRHENMVFFNYCNVDSRNIGSLETKHDFIDVDSIDVVMSKLYNKAFFSNGTENSTFSNGTGWEQENAVKYIKLSRETGTNNKTFNTISCRRFSIYKGELSEDVLKLERNKNIKLKKFYRVSGNQTNFLGIEDIFTSNNTKEILDGTIIDTTKTPIEYKEQKDISKTSDIASYTKNNINIEKSKCGYIRDIRNTNDFKNLPNNLVPEPSKYDEKYQSPTVNIVRVIDNKYGFSYGYNNTDGANVSIDNQILKTVIKNKNKSINSYPLTLIRQDSTSYIGKTMSVSFLIKGVGTTFVDIHQVRSDSSQNSVSRGRTIELTDKYTRYTISNFICNESHQNMAITVGNTVDIIEIKDIQVELSPVTTDYTPPNSDGNFIPTVGESGIFSVKQTTKDTDKNTNTFARTIFLP